MARPMFTIFRISKYLDNLEYKIIHFKIFSVLAFTKRLCVLRAVKSGVLLVIEFLHKGGEELVEI